MRRSTVTVEQIIAVFDRKAEAFKQEMAELPQDHPRRRIARACLGTTLILRDELLAVLRAADHGEVPEA
jgi:GAF domain-containing protein